MHLHFVHLKPSSQTNNKPMRPTSQRLQLVSKIRAAPHDSILLLTLPKPKSHFLPRPSFLDLTSGLNSSFHLNVPAFISSHPYPPSYLKRLFKSLPHILTPFSRLFSQPLLIARFAFLISAQHRDKPIIDSRIKLHKRSFFDTIFLISVGLFCASNFSFLQTYLSRLQYLLHASQM